MDQLKIRHLEDPVSFALQGELDMSCAEDLWARLSDVPKGSDLTLDLSELAFMDSAGLRVFLEAACVRENGSWVVLKNPTEAVARVLEIAVPGGGPGLKIEWPDGGSRNGRRPHVAR